MTNEFSTARRILFGRGALKQLPESIHDWGRKALVVTGRSASFYDSLKEMLEISGITCSRFAVEEEPTVEMVADGLKIARAQKPDFVIGIGGGSALDAGKGLAALLANTGDIMEYLEVIGEGKPLTRPSIPYAAIPTTAGTGSEVTRNAVLGSTQHGVKVSMRHPSMLPCLALVDPDLTMTVPPNLTASTGMDALTQCLEAYVSSQSNPLVDGLCREGIRRAARSLARAYHDGSDLEAREDLSMAALLSGIALANAKLGAVHGIAGPLGGTTGASHSQICAYLLPNVMRTNLQALRSREPGHSVLPRFTEVAQLLTGEVNASADDGVDWLEQLRSELNIPGLGAFGLTREQIPELVVKCQQSSSMKGNPLILETNEIEQLLGLASG